jgi:hypothetical protein
VINRHAILAKIMWVPPFIEMYREMEALRLSRIPKWLTTHVSVVVLRWHKIKLVICRLCGGMFLESKRAITHFRAL